MQGIFWGTIIGLTKRDIRSLDYGSRPLLEHGQIVKIRASSLGPLSGLLKIRTC